jgi:hypothetical protein
VSGDEIEERRFPGTIWTNDGMSFPLNEFKIDRSDCFKPVKVFMEVARFQHF